MTNEHSKGTLPPRSSSLSSTSSPTLAVSTPCAACRMLRRKCVENCILAPHFPPDEPLKFNVTHRIFGASNITKLLQELPESQREDAVSSMVYEANARIRDPVYGCTGAIFQLQNQVNDLQAQLAKAKAEIFNIQGQHATMVCINMSRSPQTSSEESFDGFKNSFDESFQSSNPSLYLDNEQETLWETIWA